MTKPLLRSTGLFLAAIGILAFVIDLILVLTRNTTATKTGPVLLFTLVYILVFIGLMLLSAFKAKLAWLQPLVFLLTSVFALLDEPEQMYGLGLFVMAMILLTRLGFFNRFRRVKVVCFLFGFTAMEVVSILIKPDAKLAQAANPVVFISIFLAFVYLAFQGRIAVYLNEPKPKLSLAERNLSPAEQAYVLALVRGKSTKEICYDFEIKESTVRNTLARAYKKLEVVDKSGLATLAERYEITA